MSFVSRRSIVDRLLRSRKARESYVVENIKRIIPFQIRAMRDEREWSQGRAADEIGKKQSVLSRLESPAYGKLTVQTLVEIAQGFDVGLVIRFVPFSRLVKEYDDVSQPALSAVSVSDKKEAGLLEQWATAEHEVPLDKRFADKLQSNHQDVASGKVLPFSKRTELSGPPTEQETQQERSALRRQAR